MSPPRLQTAKRAEVTGEFGVCGTQKQVLLPGNESALNQDEFGSTTAR